MVRWIYWLTMNTTQNINTATAIMVLGNLAKLVTIFLLGRYAQYLHRFIHVRIYGKKRKA